MNGYKSIIWQDKKFLIGSVILLFLTMAVGWILYAFFGHKLIEAIYAGRVTLSCDWEFVKPKWEDVFQRIS